MWDVATCNVSNLQNIVSYIKTNEFCKLFNYGYNEVLN